MYLDEQFPMVCVGVCENKYFLDRGGSMIIDVSGKDNISIVTKSHFLRPIVFNYRDIFFDVYHA